MQRDIDLFKEQLKEPKRVVIFVHERPDADALGSALALQAFLKAYGHEVSVVSPTMYPDFLAWLPGIENILVADQYSQEDLLEKILPIDMICCVDFSNTARLGQIQNVFSIFQNTYKVVIDHHLEPDIAADLCFCDIKAAASAEVVFRLFKGLNPSMALSKELATCLYVAIVTDTNSFKNPNTTPQTHLIAAELMDCGIDANHIQRMVYDNKSLNRLLFFSFAISQRLVVLPEFNTAYFVVQKEDYKRYDLESGDTEGLVDCALSLRGVELAAVLKETDHGVYLSLRSVGDVPANLIAKEYFQGGGHKNAAGGMSKLDLTDTIDLFERLLKQHVNKY